MEKLRNTNFFQINEIWRSFTKAVLWIRMFRSFPPPPPHQGEESNGQNIYPCLLKIEIHFSSERIQEENGSTALPRPVKTSRLYWNVAVPDEGEPSAATGVALLWEVNVPHVPVLLKQRDNVVCLRTKQGIDRYLERDG